MLYFLLLSYNKTGSNIMMILKTCLILLDLSLLNVYGQIYHVSYNDTLKNRALPHVETKWISQPLDHFNPLNTDSWQMRYYERDDFYENGGPIILFIGGEAEATGFELLNGLEYIAEQTKAALFMSEHRYYGNSLPNKGRRYQYLSSNQTLADIANLIKNIKRRNGMENSKVLVIGGSYAGNLAAWMRLRYPDIINFALATSAPVLAKLNFQEYFETVASTYYTYGGLDCYSKITNVFSRYNEMFKTQEEIARLKVMENICESTDMSNELNKHVFFRGKLGEFASNSQYGSPDSIRLHCHYLMDEIMPRSYHEMLNINSNFASIQHDFYSQENGCYSYSYDDFLRSFKSFAWSYQTCYEFGYYQTLDSSKQPFTQNDPLGDYLKLCYDAFGISSDSVEENTNNTNKIYYGLDIVNKVNKVIFTNYDMDPWHRLGIIPSNMSKEEINGNILLYGKGGSHCQDFKTPEVGESASVSAVREAVKSTLINWLR